MNWGSRLHSAPWALPFPAVVLVALAMAALATAPLIAAVWSSGVFNDSDDAMRAVEMRDFLAGQPWFDLTFRRVDPPNGMVSHWSRFVDAPLAGLDLAFGALLPPEQAERAMRIFFPFALLAVLFVLSARVARLLGGPSARVAAVALTLLSLPMVTQFAPGRIDHHAPQIVLLLATMALILQGLEKPLAMGAAAAAMAVSFAISLENAPFFAVLLAAAPILFVLDGEKARPALSAFGAGAILAFPLCYVATVPSDRYFLPACDAYSAAYFFPAMLGALALLLLGALGARLRDWRGRAQAVLAAGVAVAALGALIAPACLKGPFSGLDPLVADLWLGHVQEAKPLVAFWASSPRVVLATALPSAFGLAAALALAVPAEGVARRRLLVMAASIAAGIAAGLLHVRVFTSVGPLAMAPLAVGILAFAGRAPVAPSLRLGLSATLCFFMSASGLALALPSEAGEAQEDPYPCLKPKAFAPLASLPPARIAAPFNFGSHILAHTPHSVFAAAYHRNNHGNRIVADAFLAPPDQAETILRGAGVELVLWCREKKSSPFIERAPDGLAAALQRGEIPDWLEQKPASSGALLVFALRAKN